MSLELIYTSVPQGINPNSRGFCTAAATSGMSRPVIMRLEALSGYEFRYSISDDRVAENPVNFAHTQINTGTATRSVLSRVAYCGTDYSNRINKIAHHFLLDPGEQLLQGPAWMILQMRDQIFYERWTKEAQYLEGRNLTDLLSNNEQPAECTCKHWAKITGDAGWAGVLAKAFKDNKRVPAFVVFDSSLAQDDMLQLFRESLQVLPPQERWAVGFATYYTALPAGCQYHWRGIFSGSPASQEIMRFSGAKVIDLTKPLSQAPDNEYTEAARNGKSIGQGRVQLLIPAGRGDRADEEHRGPRITFADDSDTNIDEKLTPKPATWADRPIRFREERRPKIAGSNRSVPIPVSRQPNRKYHILWFGSAAICLLMLFLVVALWPGPEGSSTGSEGSNGIEPGISSPPSAVSQKANGTGPEQPPVINPIQKARTEWGNLYKKIDKAHPEQGQIDELVKKIEHGPLKNDEDIKEKIDKLKETRQAIDEHHKNKEDFDKKFNDLEKRYKKICEYGVSEKEIGSFISEAESIKDDAKKLSSTNILSIPPPDRQVSYDKIPSKIDDMIKKAKAIRDDLKQPIAALEHEKVDGNKRKVVNPMKRSNPGEGKWFFEVGRSAYIVGLPRSILWHDLTLDIINEGKLIKISKKVPPLSSPFLSCSLERQHSKVQLKVEDVVQDNAPNAEQYRKMIKHFVVEVAEKTQNGEWAIYQCALGNAPAEEEIEMGFTRVRVGNKEYRQTWGNKTANYPCPWPNRLIVRTGPQNVWPTDRPTWLFLSAEKAELELSKAKAKDKLEIKLISETVRELHERIKPLSNKEKELIRELKAAERQKNSLENERARLQEDLKKIKDDNDAKNKKVGEIRNKEGEIRNKVGEIRNKEGEIKKIREEFKPIKADISALKREYDAKAKFEIVDPWGRVVKRFRVTIKDQINRPKELGEWKNNEK
jgi:uncharacterized coiled-coil DUF342 family protein